MSYIGTQPNNVKENIGLYTPNDITALTKDGNWGGSLELIAEQTLSGAVSYNFTSIKETKFDVHFLTVSNHTVPAGSQDYGIRFYEGGVLETAGVYQYATQEITFGGTGYEHRSTSANYIRVDNTGSEQWINNWYMYFYNLGNSSEYSFVTLHKQPERLTSGGSYSSAGTVTEFGGGVLPQASTVDGIQIYNSATTSTAGTAKLYGVKQI